ncbi:MAG: crotonase/enoyl-CoA hydratase family protein [Mesorhizobium sp.]|nr:crotonase/enoyl-CoA hydratase family protein [Mesorhizobium sp.]MCO5160081.1 crotonase/enoyl-CoA hydratase family protein [Mesorhizobium sp.]
MSEHIVVERQGAIQTIRMNRPEKKNAITRAMYGAMARALTEGDADPAVRCHVILGVPGAFSAGNDMADFMVVAMGGDGGTEVFAFLEALARSAKPIVSAADGIAVGIGATLHLHCDVTFATPRTNFHTPFVDLGIVPEAGSTLIVPALLGTQAAFALLVMGEPLPAERAKAAGLIYEVVAEEELESRAMAAGAAIAAKPPEALKLSRDLMRGDREALVERIKEEGRLFTARLKSDETKQALMAFMARKKG